MYIEFRDVSGKTVQLPLSEDAEPITIGRNPGSSIYSKESTVSRNHGRIGFDGATFYMKDLGSSNGTFINGERTTRTAVAAGDVVRCGEVLEIHVKSGSPTGASPEREARDRRTRKPTTMGRVDEPVADDARSRQDERTRRRAEKEAERERKRREREARREREEGGHRPTEKRPQVAPEFVKNELHSRTRKDSRDDDLAPVHKASPASVPAPRPVTPAPRPITPPPAPARSVRKNQTTGQSRVVKAIDDSPASAAEISELRRKVAALEAALADAQSGANQAENQAKVAEQRAMRYSVELDGLGDKYVKLKEQNKSMSSALEEVREELRQREDDAFEAERKVTELDAEINGAREKAADATEQLSGLKVRVTQKDRQIEELQRQLDLLEYELRSQRDEMESLQTEFNREGGDAERLERKINLLQEVIEEKESVIEQLRIDLRDKDIEIRQVRMGVGISDLEHEKRTLLEDYHNSMRRIDELQQEVSKKQREIDEMRDHLESERKAVEDRKSAGPEDITEHPDFKAKLREVERLEEKIEDLQREVARFEVKLENASAGSEQATKLEAELELLNRRNESLQGKLDTAEEQVAQLRDMEPVVAEPKSAVTPEVLEDVESLVDATAAAKANARIVRKYAANLEKGIDGDLAEDAELLYDTAVVLVQDLGEQERVVKDLLASLSALQDDEP